MSKSGGVILSNTDSYKIQIITKYLTGKLYKNQASELLNVSERTVSRYAKQMREKGPFGVRHGNCGKAVNRKWSPEFVQEIINLKINTYYDFNTSHFVDLLKKEHKIEVPYQTVWGWLKEKNLIKQPHRRRRRKKHVYRPRMPQEGLLLQMDGFLITNSMVKTTGCLYLVLMMQPLKFLMLNSLVEVNEGLMVTELNLITSSPSLFVYVECMLSLYLF